MEILTRPITRRLTRPLTVASNLDTYDTGGGHRPPVGYGWVVYTDPATSQQRIAVDTDPTSGQQRPVIQRLTA